MWSIMLALKTSFGIFPTQQSKADLIDENPDKIGYLPMHRLTCDDSWIMAERILSQV